MHDNTGIDPNSVPVADGRTDQDLPLPPGWEQKATPDGRVFYANHNKRINTWNDPRNPNQENESVIASLPGPPLPTGWDAQYQPDGRVYFVDHNTKSTTYEDPRGESAGDSIAAASVSVDSSPLPASWEEKWTPGGKVYFIDHNTKSTTWTDPRQTTSSPGTAT